MLEKETERKRNTQCVGCCRRKTTGRNNICSIYITQEEEEEEEQQQQQQQVFLIRNIMSWMLEKKKKHTRNKEGLRCSRRNTRNVWEQMRACVQARSRTLLSLGLAVQSEG
jgi:hypothetical protein